MNSLLYITTVLIWGSSWFAIKFQLGLVPPELSVAYRFGLASIILLIFSLIRNKKLRFSYKDHAYFLLLGFLLFSFNYLLIYFGSAHLTSGLVSVLFSCIVLMNIFFNRILFKKTVERKVLWGAVMGIGGLIIIFRPELVENELASESLKGFFFVLAATAVASLGNLTSARNQKHGLPVLQTNAFSMGYGALIMLVWGFIHNGSLIFNFSSSYLISLVYLAVFASILAFSAYLTLLGRIGPEKASYSSVLFPAIALLISAYFESYQITPDVIGGFLLVLTGNILVLTPSGLLKKILLFPNRTVSR